MAPQRHAVLGRHHRFLIAFGSGLAVAAATIPVALPVGTRALIGVDAFFAGYLILMVPLLRLSPAAMRARAATEDEGTALIAALAVLAIGVSLYGIAATLTAPQGSRTGAALALAALPLGWAMMQTLAGFHYAHLFYSPRAGSPYRGGLVFPGTGEPGPWDFLYLAFGIGMTAQVSDVQVTDSTLRRVVLAHAVIAFFTNTVILALAVTAAASLRV